MQNPLTRHRDKLGWSVAKLAARSTVSASTIALIETGVSKRPHADTVGKLAGALGVDVADLERELFDWNHARKAAA